MDWSVTNSTRLMLRWTHDSWKADRNQWGDDPFPVVRSLWNQPGKSLVAQLNQNIGSTMVNCLTFSYSANTIDVARGRRRWSLSSSSPQRSPRCSRPTSSSRRCRASRPRFGVRSGTTADGTLWNQAPWLNNQDLFVLKDDYSAVFGKHFVKTGALFSYNKKNEEPANTSQESVAVNGTAGFLGPSGFVPGLTTGNTIANWLLQGMVWNTDEIRTNKPVQQRWNDFEFYIADTYKASPRVTADFGVRLSHFTLPYDGQRPDGEFRPAASTRPWGTRPVTACCTCPGTNPCPALGLAGGSDGPNRSLSPSSQSCSRPGSASPGTYSAPARRPSAAGSASSMRASG